MSTDPGFREGAGASGETGLPCGGSGTVVSVSHGRCNRAPQTRCLKQRKRKRIIVQCWRSGVQNGSRRVTVSTVAGFCSFGRLMGRLHSWPFPVSRSRLHPLAWGPFLHLQSRQCSIFQEEKRKASRRRTDFSKFRYLRTVAWEIQMQPWVTPKTCFLPRRK